MKTFLQTLFFFLLVTQICFAQWYQQNSGTNIDLIDVDFFDANNGIAVGWHIRNPGYFSESIVFRTTNSGESWNIQGYYYDIISVQCLDSLNGFGVGYATFIKTVDGGITWTQQAMGNNTILSGVNFSDGNTGITVGYDFDSLWNSHSLILRTTDGGVSWLNQTSPEFYYLFATYFVDNNYGWIVGEVKEWYPLGGVILNTTDGGTTWTEQWNSTMISLTDVYFTDVYNGVAVGTGGTILRTTGGGTSWTSEISGTTADL